MDKQKSALTISIIALIISIIALLLVLWLGYGCCSQCCKKSHECPQKEEPAAAAVVEKTEAYFTVKGTDNLAFSWLVIV
jgi:hypothetical protein